MESYIKIVLRSLTSLLFFFFLVVPSQAESSCEIATPKVLGDRELRNGSFADLILGINLYRDDNGVPSEPVFASTLLAGESFFAEVTVFDSRPLESLLHNQKKGVIALPLNVKWDSRYIEEIDAPWNPEDKKNCGLITCSFPLVRGGTLSNERGEICSLRGAAVPSAGAAHGFSIGGEAPERFSLLHFRAKRPIEETTIRVGLAGGMSFSGAAVLRTYKNAEARITVREGEPDSDSLSSKRGWHNAKLPEDVDQNNLVTPQDVLRNINLLNSPNVSSSGVLPERNILGIKCDVDNNGLLSPMDVLQIINHLNNPPEEPVRSRPFCEERRCEKEERYRVASFLVNFYGDENGELGQCIDPKSIKQGESIFLEILVKENDWAYSGLQGVSLNLDWDPEVLEVADLPFDPEKVFTPHLPVYVTGTYQPENGRIVNLGGSFFLGVGRPIGEGKYERVALIRFRVREGGKSTPIRISQGESRIVTSPLSVNPDSAFCFEEVRIETKD